jgi:probable O-glycosylation ligase (exosortase A-associated)
MRGGLAVAGREAAVAEAPVIAAAAMPAPIPASPLAGVEWSLTLAGFLLYLLVITSYRLPLGEVSIVMALAGTFTSRGGVRVPVYFRCFVAFSVWAALVTTQTAYPDWAIPQLIILGKLCLIVFAAANALQTRSQIRLFMVFFLGCFALFPLRGAMFNFFLYQSDMQGRAIWNLLYSNPNDLGAMALLQLSMAAALLCSEPKGWVRRAATLGVVALPMLILMTQSRGVFLGLLVFIALAFAGHQRRVRLGLRLMVVAAILASVAPAGVWTRLQTLQHATDTSTLDQVDGEEGSARQRYEIWKVAFKIIREHPVVGVGFGAYKPTHERYAMDPEFNPTARGARDTHSLYFNVLAETGFPGLTIYLSMILAIAITAERTRRRCRRIYPTGARQLLLLEAGLLAFLVSSTFGSLPYLPHFLLHLVLMYAVSMACSRQVDEIIASGGAGLAFGPRRGGARIAAPGASVAVANAWSSAPSGARA